METQTRLLLAASALALSLALPGHVIASDELEDVDFDNNGKPAVVEEVKKDQEKDNASGGWWSWIWGSSAKSDDQNGADVENANKSSDVKIEEENQDKNDDSVDRLNIGELSDDSEDELQESKRVQELQEELERQKEELEKEKEASEKLQLQLENQAAELSDLAQQKEEAEQAKRATEEKIAEKEAQKETDEEELRNLQSDSAKNKEAIDKLTKKMSVQSDLLQTLREQADKASLEAEEKEQALAKLSAQQETTQSSLAAAKEKAARLGKEVHLKDNQISQMKKELKTAKRKARELEVEKLRLEEEARKKEEQLAQVFGDTPITQSVMFTVQKQRSNVVDLGDTSTFDFLYSTISLTSGHEIRLYSQFTYYLISDQNTLIFKGDDYKPAFLNKYFRYGVNKAMVLEGDTFRYPQKLAFRPNIQYDVKSLHSDAIKTVDGTGVVDLIEASGLEFRGPYLMTPHAK